MTLFLRKFHQLKRIFLNEEEEKFIKYNPESHENNKNKSIVLIEMTEDIYFIIHFYFLMAI